LYDFSKTTGDTVTIIVVYDRLQNVFGRTRRQWGFYEYSVLTSIYILREVTDSIGLTSLRYEPGVAECLSGAIINGIQYGTITSIEQTFDLINPREYEVFQNYPNPFNSLTQIIFRVSKESYVTIVVTDIIGKYVRKLFRGTVYCGVHHITWDGKDDFGKDVGSGMYFYTVQMDHLINTKKIMLLR
jgi:hypothetical protein